MTGHVRAGEPGGKITVEGVGTVLLTPDVAEIRAKVSGSATLASDAIKKYRDNRRRAVELLRQLHLKDLVIEGRGPVVGPSVANDGQQNGFFVVNNVVMPGNQQVTGMTFVEPLVIRMPSIDRMKEDDVLGAVVKILDVAKDAGLSVSSVQFKSTKIESSRTEAVRNAVQAAHQNAALLAELSHARVGPVISIQQTGAMTPGFEFPQSQSAVDSDETAGASANAPVPVAFGFATHQSTTSIRAAIPVRAAVSVEFALDRGK